MPANDPTYTDLTPLTSNDLLPLLKRVEELEKRQASDAIWIGELQDRVKALEIKDQSIQLARF